MIMKLIYLLALCVYLLSPVSIATPMKKGTPSKNYCRTHIFAPRCRGLQKRDVNRLNEENIRLPILEDIVHDNPAILGELLRKITESPDDDYLN